MEEEIDTTSAEIVMKLGIDDRIQKYTSDNAYLTLKDHKPNFTEKKALQINQPCKKPNRKDKQTTSTRNHTENTNNSSTNIPDTMAQHRRSEIMVQQH